MIYGQKLLNSAKQERTSTSKEGTTEPRARPLWAELLNGAKPELENMQREHAAS